MKKNILFISIILVLLIIPTIVSADPPNIKLVVNPTSGDAPLTVSVDEDSGDATIIRWEYDFGDGGLLKEKKGEHVYETEGEYTLTLIVFNEKEEKSSETRLITVNAPPTTEIPVAGFTAEPLSGMSPLVVYFTDTSTNAPTSWNWSFGDGSTSTDQNPKHQFLKVNTYTVSLTVENSAGQDTETKSGYITVTEKQETGTIPLQEGITETTSTKVDIISTTGSIKLTDKQTGFEVTSSTKIDDLIFTPSKTTINNTVIWDTGGTTPDVSFEYRYLGHSLKESVTLTKDVDLKFPLLVSKDTKLIPWYNGEWKLVSATSGYTMDGIVLEKPYGIDTNGNYVEMEYKYDEATTTLHLIYNRTITVYTVNETGKDPVEELAYIPIKYPLVIDPTWTAYNGHWISQDGDYTIEMWNASGTGSFNATIIPNPSNVTYWVVGGGGGGGKSLGGGGGGAGGYWTGNITNLSGIINVSVGAGGAAATVANTSGVPGQPTIFWNGTASNITAAGGGGGGSRSIGYPTKGGSGGGGGSPASAGSMAGNSSNQSGHGNSGDYGAYNTSTAYSGGGGGGMITTGWNARSNVGGNGGRATLITLNGTNISLAGGGGGGVYSSTAANRGLGGNNTTGTVGGSGGYRTNAASSAVAATGSGGGGGGSTGAGSAGSGGVIYIRYKTPVLSSFTVNRNRGSSPMTVTFTDTSMGTPTSWFWVFGDGSTENNTQQNPVHTFTSANNSIYQVNVTATNAEGSDTSPVVEIKVSAVGSAILNWTQVAAQLNSQQHIRSLTTYDDGSGTAIYGGTGGSGGRLFKYNSSLANWTQVAAQLNSQSDILSLTTYDDGTGTAIYAGTYVDTNGGRLFKYNTSLANWTQVAALENDQWFIYSLVTYDDGSGNAIFGGTADGGRLFKYNTSLGSWSQVAGPLNSQTHIFSLTTYDDGSGTAIYGGTSPGGRLFKYNTSLGGWSQVAAQLNSQVTIYGLVTYDDGSGNAIYGGTGNSSSLFKYNTTLANWSQVAGQLGSETYIRSLTTYDDGSGNAIYGGTYNGSNLFKYNTSLGGWSQVAAQLNSQTFIYSLTTYDDGSGNTIYGGTSPGGRLYKAEYISAAVPVATFTSNVTSGTAPTSVQFNDTSTNTPTSWNWSYRNVTGNNTTIWWSTVQNATGQFGVGNWSIQLNASNAGGSNLSTQVTFINVSAGEAATGLVANFTQNATSGTAPANILFTDTSTGTPTGWAWFFGDELYTQEWTLKNSSPSWAVRYGHTSVALPDGSAVIMGGRGLPSSIYYNDTWRSTNSGATWTQQSATAGWSGRWGLTSVVTDNGTILIMGGNAGGGHKGDTWQSVDKGVTWAIVNSSGGWNRSFFSAVYTTSGAIVIVGGGYDSTYKSINNGTTWTQVNASSGFAARTYQSAAALPDGSIVLMGGYSSTYLNDTWRSTNDGATWTQMNASSGWSIRGGLAATAMPDNSILISGGGDGEDVFRDVWRSTDLGATWTRVNTSAGWSPGYWAHTLVTLTDGSVLQLGGDDYSDPFNSSYNFNPVGSSSQTPVHTYTANGNYSIVLRAYHATDYDDTVAWTHWVNLSSGGVAPVASFTINDQFIRIPVNITATDSSTNTPTSWQWSWGDGSANATTQNPQHRYNKRGAFIIILTATNGAGSNVSQPTTVKVTGYETYW